MSTLSSLKSFLRRPARGGLLLGTTWLLASCGGGVSVGIGIGDDDFLDDHSPSVSMTVSQTVVAPGQAVRLVAAASDRSGIEQVAFYQVENGGALLLFADGQAPYEFDAVTPNDGRASVQYFARATNYRGRRADSATQTVTLQGR